jgi:uncharacterized protein
MSTSIPFSPLTCQAHPSGNPNQSIIPQKLSPVGELERVIPRRVMSRPLTKANVICIIISLRIIMQLEEIKKKKQQLYQIAAKHGITRIYVFGSVARGESEPVSDIDFLIEMDENVSALGVGAFQYEVQQLLGTKIDVIPTFALQNVEDQAFVRSVRSDSVAL